jgi:kynurenine formamidase
MAQSASVILWMVLAGCVPSGLPVEDHRLVDLSYTFDETTLYWPTDQRFFHNQVARGITPGGYWYSSYQYGGSEHGGTHLDAPIHFGEGKRTVDELPLEQLIAPGVVVDIAKQCETDPDYLLSADDLEAHEREQGAIAPGSIVLVRTGWGRFWPDAKQYLGSDTPGDTANLRFPGVSPEAARLLAQRRVALVGIDTASIDRGASRDFQAHQIFGAANIGGLENVANLDQLPAQGFTIIALPMKIGAGSGAPCRVVAMVRLETSIAK